MSHRSVAKIKRPRYQASPRGSNGDIEGSAVLDPHRRRAILRVMCLSLMMVVAAVASLNIALPNLARDLGATQTELQWIVDAYAVVFAGLLLPAGAIGDRYGRRTVLLAGLAVFGLASAGAIFAGDAHTLIALRAVMGVGAAMVMPVTLSIITSTFPKEERGQAVGVWAGVAAGGAVIGLLISGALLEGFSWESIFILNVVLAVAALIGTVAVVPDSKDPDAGPIDVPGGLLSMVGLSALIFAIIEGPERGWTDLLTAAGFVVAVGALIAFVLWELRTPRPMLDPRLFRLSGFTTGSLSITLQFFAAFGFFYVALQYAQLVLDYSPLQSGLAMLPMGFVVIALSPRVHHLVARLGVRAVNAGGLGLMAAAFGVLSTLGVDSSYWHFAAGLVVLGAGMALSTTPATTAIVAALPASKQGVASAVNDTARELGGALGIAILGSVLNDRYSAGIAGATRGLPAEAAEPAAASLAAALQISERLGAPGAGLAEAARAAFIDGLSGSLVAAAIAIAVGALVVALRSPGRASAVEHATGQAPATAP